jgi:CDP-4-dehydro-6-deoxyglucose reductase
MKEKDILRMEGPFGSFFLREDSDKPIVLLASGTGFAPIKALIEQLQLKAAAPGRRCCTGAAAAGQICTCTTGPRPPRLVAAAALCARAVRCQAEDGWAGRTGLVHQAVMADLPDLSATRSMPAACR